MPRPRKLTLSSTPPCKEINPSKTLCGNSAASRVTSLLETSMMRMNLKIVRLRGNVVVARTSTILPSMLKTTRRQMVKNLQLLKKTKTMMTILQLSKSKRRKRNNLGSRLRKRERSRKDPRLSAAPSLLRLNACVKRQKPQKRLLAIKQTSRKNASLNCRSKKNCNACESSKLPGNVWPKRKLMPRKRLRKTRPDVKRNLRR